MQNKSIQINYHIIAIMFTFTRILLLVVLCMSVYAQYGVSAVNQGSTFVELTLKYTGQDDYYVKPKSLIVKQLTFIFKALTYNDFSFKIYDPNQERFQVPQGGIFPQDHEANFSFPLSVASYQIKYTPEHFSFNITRKSTGAVLFDSSVVELQFSDYYLQIGTVTDSKTLFGFSQRFTEHFSLKAGTWTIWNKDNGQKLDSGATGTGGIQTHGYYPVYLQRQRSGDYHMGYFRTSDAMDVEVESFSNQNFLKIYRTIGGIIDFRFFVGEKDPEELLTTFHSNSGPAMIPPFWSMGFHQCRWGYHNVSVLQTVLTKYEQNGIPLDVIWSDIDYMHDYQTFTVDTDNFPLDRMKNITNRYKYIPIIEPSIRNRQGYAWQEGKKRNVYIQSAEGEDQVGKVWAGLTQFVDYFHPNATTYWSDMLQHLHTQIDFSGCWLDMNQISNLCDGPCEPPTGSTVIDYTHDIPYHPGGKNIQMVNIPLNATHYGNKLQAHTHVFFGMMESYNTYQYLKKIQRPFILTRSHTLGSKRYAAHWTGDNYSNFTFLKLSIGGLFMQNMLGMQMAGSDICGFGGNTTEELCARFFQLGSLYPFARNHNQDTSVDQEAYALGPVVMQAAKKNLKLRYSLLKSYYREFLIRKGLGTIFRPLFFQFYNDQNVMHEDIMETQLLIGRAIMSTPIVESGAKQRSAYFPGDSWFNLQTGQEHKPGSLASISSDLTDYVPLFIRSGWLIFKQNTDNVTKTQHLTNKFEMIVGCKLISNDSEYIVYKASGGLLSLGDYQSNMDVQNCLREGCDYQITITLLIQKASNQKQVTLQTKLQGSSVRKEQTISHFTFFLEGGDKLSYSPPQKMPIFEDEVKTFNLVEQFKQQ